MSFSLVLEKKNQEEERFVSIKSGSLPPLLRPTLASTELALNSISLEVYGTCLHVDIIKDEPRTWFFSGQAATTSKSRSLKVYDTLSFFFGL